MPTDNILLLPVEILVNILKRLHLTDLRNVMLTCKSFNDLIKNDNTIWRPLARYRLMVDWSNSSKSNELWFNRCRTAYNWCNGYYNSKVLIYHFKNSFRPMPWLSLHQSEILLVSMGGELYCYRTNRRGCLEALWKVDAPEIEYAMHTITTDDISRFVVTCNYITCGNRDGSVALYKTNNTLGRPWLQYHIQYCHQNEKETVAAVEAIEGMTQVTVISGSSYSPELRFCTITKENNTNTTNILRGNETNIRNIALYDENTIKKETTGTTSLALNNTLSKLAIGIERNSRPLVLDVNKLAFVLTADSTVNYWEVVHDIRWHDDNTIVYVTRSGVLEMIDMRTCEVVYNIKDPFNSPFYCVKSDGKYGIVAGSAENSRCVLFDSRNRHEHVQMLFTQGQRMDSRLSTSPVFSLDFDPCRLITAVELGVAVSNFNVVADPEERNDYSYFCYTPYRPGENAITQTHKPMPCTTLYLFRNWKEY